MSSHPAILFAVLPALGSPLDTGIFAGLITQPDGTHCAVVLLPEKGEKLTWKKAMNWAQKQDAELPSRPVASMLFANCKPALQPGWHWTSEQDDASSAWHCSFDYGDINLDLKSYVGSAVAVRLIPITA